MRALLLSLLLASAASAQTGTIAGQVFEADGVTGVIGANVRVGRTTFGAATDLDGHYQLVGVPVGSYDITASYVGARPIIVTGVDVEAGRIRGVSFTLNESDTASWGPCIYEPPMFTNDAFASRILSRYEIENMPISR